MCQKEMPFRRRDGEYYFEAVQLFDDLAAEYASAHLACCPLCAAKYKELVKKDDERVRELRDGLRKTDDLTIPIQLGSESGSLRFVEKHLLDIRALLEAEGTSSEVAER